MQSTRSIQKTQRAVALLVIIALVAGLLGIMVGRWSMGKQYPMLNEAAFQNLNKTYIEVLSDYLNGAEAADLIHGAAEGMVNSLGDPYSSYYTKEQGSTYLERYEESFVGIGIEIRQENGEFLIRSIVKNTPAAKAGLEPDDRIVKVDGEPLQGKELSEILKLTRGEEGTEVILTIEREGMKTAFEAVLIRATVPVTTINYEMLEHGIGSIQITRFSESTATEFDHALEELQQAGMKGLLLDLRMNPGGLLKPAITIASRMVPKDKVIVQVVYKDEDHEITHRSKQDKPWKLPMVVLVDERSASSAEVLAAALKDSADVEIIGVKTYGKGIVQTFQQFKDKSVLKLTEAQWRTPDGQWIQEEGIEPTVEVTMPDYALLPSLPSDLDISIGNFGQDVKTAEQLLLTLGYLPGEPEGIYDEETKKAVMQFQHDELLPADGVLSGRTSYRLMERVRDKIVREDPQQRKAVEMLMERL